MRAGSNFIKLVACRVCDVDLASDTFQSVFAHDKHVQLLVS